MEKNYRQTETGHCLECGDAFSSAYGRADRKFCCPQCRSRYHYREIRDGRIMRNRVTARLEKNYEILSQLLDGGIDSLSRTDAVQLGVDLEYMTSCFIAGRKMHCSCYDISYRLTDYGIKEMSKSLTNFGTLKIK